MELIQQMIQPLHLSARNVDFLNQKSGQPLSSCQSKPGPSYNSTCSSTEVNGLDGTGCAFKLQQGSCRHVHHANALSNDLNMRQGDSRMNT